MIYIIGTYPLLTTTFIDREIALLRQWGIDLQVVSIRKPPTEIPLSRNQVDLQKSVLYLLPVDVPKLLFSHIFYATTKPLVFWKTLVYLLTRPHPTLASRAKTLLHFGEGVYTAYLLRKQQFHEIHAHFVDRAGTVALVVGKLLNRPYSLSIHAAEDIFVHPMLLDEKISGARHVVTCTMYNKTYLETLLGHSLEKVTHAPHGLNITKYQPEPTKANGKPYILSVGQLAERKGLAQLIEACSTLKHRGYEFQCEIVGDGPQRQTLANLVTSLDLEDYVTLCGALPHEDVIEKYKNATMFALPCIQSTNGNLDGIPNVLFEAMAMQVPVISTRVSAIPELIEDGVNGILVAPNDPAELAEALITMIDSPQQATRLGRSGRESVQVGFDVESNVRHFAMTLWPELFN